MKIAVDVGGVLSKYPEVFRPLIELAYKAGKRSNVEVHIISDMHPRQKIIDALVLNGFAYLPADRVHSADYKAHGEMCKAVLCEQLGIDILIDDFPGYVAVGNHVRLLVMPQPTEPYYHDDWETDGSEGEFGRRNPPGSKRPPEDRKGATP
jgi:hypothetical protein